VAWSRCSTDPENVIKVGIVHVSFYWAVAKKAPENDLEIVKPLENGEAELISAPHFNQS
jgi:hypothetical protein